jgi:hypothetical protein
LERLTLRGPTGPTRIRRSRRWSAPGGGFVFQVSKATPRKSPSRQTSRHLRMVRKLSKDRSKFTGSTDRSCVRRQAPLFVMSVTPQERTPICPLKNSKAPFAILVLPIDLRSAIQSASAHWNALPVNEPRRGFVARRHSSLKKIRRRVRKAVVPAAPCLKLGPTIPSTDESATTMPS